MLVYVGQAESFSYIHVCLKLSALRQWLNSSITTQRDCSVSGSFLSFHSPSIAKPTILCLLFLLNLYQLISLEHKVNIKLNLYILTVHFIRIAFFL